MHESQRVQRRSQVAWGGFLVLLGTAFLLRNIGVLDLDAYWRYWPVVMIGLGIASWLGRVKGEGNGGLWLAFAGALLLLNNLRLLRFRQAWPLFLVLAGATIVLQALQRPAMASVEEPHEE